MSEETKLLDIIVSQKAHIAELEEMYHEERIRADRLFDEALRLREGIAAHKDSFTNPDDYTEEDLALWALLEKGEQE